MEEMIKITRGNKMKILMFLTLTIVLLMVNLDYVIRFIGVLRSQISKFDVDYVQGIVESFGALGVLVYILLNCIRPLLFIPTTIMYVSGGLIYGKLRGSVYTLIGLIGGSSIPFFLARRFQNLFKRILGNKYLSKMDKIDDSNVTRRLFTIRVTPGLPFDIVSYLSGVTGVPYKEFIIGSLLGAFPKIFLYSILGDQLDNIFSLQTIIIFLVLLFLAVSPHIFRNKFHVFNK